MDDHPGAGGRHKGVLTTQETLLPRDLDELIHCGGVAYIERVAATKASADATRSEREFWLPILEHCLAEEKAADKDEWPNFRLLYLESEIKRLRKGLGIKTTDEERRAQTRDRVRRHRASKRWK
jgi:hypothetical protein